MKGLVWLRRDLRLHDQTALSMATKECHEVELVFVFDKVILDKLKDKTDKRVSFIYECLSEIDKKVGIHILYGDPTVEIPKLFKKLSFDKLFFNRDYEPTALKRDSEVMKLIPNTVSYKDSVFFEPHEVLKNDGKPYTVFTPYKRKWLERFSNFGKNVSDFKVKKSLIKRPTKSLDEKIFKKIGFQYSPSLFKGGESSAKKELKRFEKKIDRYDELRDFPAADGTSNLSVYIRHGCLSIRELINFSIKGSSKGRDIWLSELIWREFYQMILAQFPKVIKKCFKEKYEGIDWRGGAKELKAWKEGQTGFPIVDAAMRCLNETGTMPNRLRMVTASFLCKTLLVDYKKGEKYFAEKLLDFDLASNNGGWQWSSSTGCDAQPYFRIFNPYSQSEKFDGEGIFIRNWCPELKGFSSKKIHCPSDSDMIEQTEAACRIGVDYPYPVVDYRRKREEAMKMYKEGIS
ncbi:MAG: deoxyribodipyrimidine photo-lyase [Bacteriovoracaceae bacterium]|jgi:deoxyribodipyrimidine photo-lyase